MVIRSEHGYNCNGSDISFYSGFSFGYADPWIYFQILVPVDFLAIEYVCIDHLHLCGKMRQYLVGTNLSDG